MASPDTTETMTPIRLTQTVKKGGCAAKLPAGQLREALSQMNLKRPAELEVGTEKLDDACLWKLDGDRYLIQTLDFFTPIVDDAYDFGAIAAANALSDVYAMGGEPKTALSILAFPAATLPMDLLGPLMKGAIEKIEESGACLAGGHSIDDETLKLGFSVSGFVSQKKAWKNSGSKAGDVLILTKGLGTGTITTALKNGEAPKEAILAAIQSMKMLNRAPELLKDFEIHSATDVTGFGLSGHALQMAQASGVHFTIDTARLPLLEGALYCLSEGNINRAHKTNLDYANPFVSWSDQISESLKWITLDPQTSGGLLLSVSARDADSIVALLKKQFPLTSVIGQVKAQDNSSRAAGPQAQVLEFT